MALDTLTLKGTSLNDETNYALEALDLTPPPKKPEWAQSSDGDGSDLVRTPLFENRTITMTLRVMPQASKDAALEKVGTLADLLQEAEKNPDGIALVYKPATATKEFTFYVLTGAITAIPMVNEGSSSGWYNAHAPQLNISLTCKPFGYGAEVTGAAAKTIETGLSTVVLTVATLAGDVPAEGRLVVVDTAAIGRRYVEWGLEQRYYNSETALILDNESMTAVGGAPSEAANTGAYKPSGTKGTIATTLLTEPTICANTGNLKHIGTFRVKCRVQAVLGEGSMAEKVHVRLAYQDGEGPLRANDWQSPLLGGKFVEVNLGIITLTTALKGTQKWLGQIEAYSENAATKDVLHVDYLTFIPVLEGYGKARGQQSNAPGTIVAFDNFSTGTLSGNLNTRTPAVGAAWATSGAATDWTVETGKAKRATKSDAGPRWGVLGAAVGNSAITAVLRTTLVANEKLEAGLNVGAILRWVDSNNYAFARLSRLPFVAGLNIECNVGVKVAGVVTFLANSIAMAPLSVETYTATIDFEALVDGSMQATFKAEGRSVTLAATSSAVATGGALASGKPGVFDEAGAPTSSRLVESVSVSQLGAIPYCVQPSRTMEVRNNATIAADSAGTYYGNVPAYRGSRFYVPQDGSENRTSRIIVKADRNDLEAADQQTIADAFTAECKVTPRYHVIPR